MIILKTAPYRAYLTGQARLDAGEFDSWTFLEADQVKALVEKYGDSLLVDIWDGTKYVPVNEEQYNSIVGV